MLVVDAANVIGSRPDGWWRDRPAAVERLYVEIDRALTEGRVAGPITVVLEGAARSAPDPTTPAGAVRVVRAAGSGDDAVVAVVAEATASGDQVRVVTSDRGLRDRVGRLGATVVGPRWLLG